MSVDLGKRWCDLTVGEYVAIERIVWLASSAIWGIGSVLVGWLFLRWRRRRLERSIPAVSYPFPELCLEPGPADGPASRCTLPNGHGPDHAFVPYGEAPPAGG